MNILAPRSDTTDNIYSFSEGKYVAAYFAKAKVESHMYLLTIDELISHKASLFRNPTIVILMFMNTYVLKWLNTCMDIADGNVYLYGLAARTYESELVNTYPSLKIIKEDYLSDLFDEIVQSKDFMENYLKYDSHEMLSLPIIPIISSCGCYGQCRFCAVARFRKKVVQRTADDIFREIKHYYSLGKYRFYFADSCFINNSAVSKERARTLAQLIVSSKMKIRFQIETRADCLDETTLSLLKEAGLRNVFLGIENFDNRVLRRFGKQIDSEQNLNAIKLLERMSISSTLSLILFDPFTTCDEIRKNIQIILDNGIYKHINIMGIFRRMVVLPNSNLYTAVKADVEKYDDELPDWYAEAYYYLIENAEVREFERKLYKQYSIWKIKIDNQIESIQSIKERNEFRNKQKELFLKEIMIYL